MPFCGGGGLHGRRCGLADEAALDTQANEWNPIAMSVPTAMRALWQTSLNGPQDLRLITDAPVSSLGPGEVLIRVTPPASNFVDISQARGTFAGGPQPPYLAVSVPAGWADEQALGLVVSWPTALAPPSTPAWLRRGHA
jgi:hypothetical protein